MQFDALGWCDLARKIKSPNCDERSVGMPVDMVVIHNIHLPPGQPFAGDDIQRLFTNTLDPNAHPDYAELAKLRVSAHFLIRRSGELLQFVPCSQRAWHAGVSSWQGRERCNDFSIGIELEGSDFLPFEAAQYLMLNTLLLALAHNYPLEFVLGHSQIAPGRKTDPGPFFDWSHIALPQTLSEKSAALQKPAL
ncbi:1,6-anhydro-N-acetylmuramyl-L-alanine amidase AmpD [Iodobacter fluviatilis]|jgi:AmpD protein|uniref:1,6-anhydro-N-acetylmuramyl-L-alanine amidase AmpD n=1 Tax=Iodobacter fluviatilis TaxID=537 RepID=A0A7G3GA26_9NEIS|nr:1,6-anhydro-N-acetylmuramyl-L-alanine amidase AmpD [Iodobacter fluviatilis]QBC43933.1 1,6-anhydro-N-acetylmuramyl-L-alanine amidase AmpD [Iodobacter fluviatilis]